MLIYRHANGFWLSTAARRLVRRLVWNDALVNIATSEFRDVHYAAASTCYAAPLANILPVISRYHLDPPTSLCCGFDGRRPVIDRRGDQIRKT